MGTVRTAPLTVLIRGQPAPTITRFFAAGCVGGALEGSFASLEFRAISPRPEGRILSGLEVEPVEM